MARITYILQDGQQVSIEGEDDYSVMEIGVRNGVAGIVAECGGACVCATCHVYVESDPRDVVRSRGEDEELMLEEAIDEVKPNSRLSCQIRLNSTLDGLVVRVAKNS